MLRIGFLVFNWFVCLLLPLLLVYSSSHAQEKAYQARYALIIAGASGAPVYKQRFQSWAEGIYTVLHDQFQFTSEALLLFMEDPGQAPERITGRATREAIRAALTRLAQKAPGNSLFLMLLIGHGSYDGVQAKFNILGPDLTDQALRPLLDAIPSRHQVVINTASASGPFIQTLSRSGRVIITATKSGRERHATQFAGLLQEALTDGKADLNKDNRISILELFNHTRLAVAAWYEKGGLVATEHPLLDDNGDDEGSREPTGVADSDGALASHIFLNPPVSIIEASSGDLSPETVAELRVLETRRGKLEDAIENLKTQKSSLPATDYQNRLQTLLIELARVGNRIRTLKAQAQP